MRNNTEWPVGGHGSMAGAAHRTSSRLGRVCVLLLAGFVTIHAGRAAAETTAPSPWSFNLTPYLWVSGIGGNVEAPNRRIPAQSVSAGFGNVMSHLNKVPVMAAAELRYDRFGLAMDVMAVSVKTNFATDNRLFSGGSASVGQIIGSAALVYRLADTPAQAFDLGAGLRAFAFSSSLTVNPGLLPGFQRSLSATWVNPIAVIRYRARLAEDWSATFYGDIGGGGSGSLTWQLLGTIDYTLSDSMIMRIGYRHLQFQNNGDKLHANMSMSGPILGTTFRF